MPLRPASAHRPRRLLALCLALGVLVLAGCGGEEPSTSATDETSGPTSPSASEASPSAEEQGLPACAELWVDGADLPQPYKGCTEGETEVPADALGCSSGQKIIRYQDRFYAVPGGLIREVDDRGLDRDPDYRSAIATCRG